MVNKWKIDPPYCTVYLPNFLEILRTTRKVSSPSLQKLAEILPKFLHNYFLVIPGMLWSFFIKCYFFHILENNYFKHSTTGTVHYTTVQHISTIFSWIQPKPRVSLSAYNPWPNKKPRFLKSTYSSIIL